jgi:hypothetical protein
MREKLFKSTVIGIVLLTISSLVPQTSLACMGTFRPNCGQTAWLAKFISSSIVLPGTGADITVPIGLVPYVLWNPTSPCAQPQTAALDLTLTCTAAGGGSPIVIGPTSVPVGVPVFSGAQSVLTGAGGAPVLGGPFQFPISGGTLPVGASYSCLVQGAFTVGFGPGTGAPVVTGLGDTEVCLVEEAPGQPGVPRFGFRLLDEAGGPFTAVRRGDQAYNHYLAVNNDPNLGVNLTFHSSTNQIARMPPDDNPDNTLVALSDPTAGTDNFAQVLFQNLPPNGLLPLGDPTAPNTGLHFDRFLGPNDLDIHTVVTRPHGMCTAGSCSEALLKATGHYSNGDPVLGCAGTAIIVDEVPGRYPMCEVTDMLQTADTVDSQWSPLVFNNDHHLSIHGVGNLDTLGGTFPPGTQTTGPVLAELFGIIGFPPMASDYLRTEETLSQAHFQAFFWDQASGFAQQFMDVTLANFPEEFNVIIPAIAHAGQQSSLRILLEVQSGHIVILDYNTGEFVYEGYLEDLIATPPDGISVDQNTFRKISKTESPSGPLLTTRPLSFSALRSPADPPETVDVAVFDPRNNQALGWNASSDNSLVTFGSNSGSPGENVLVNFDPATIAEVPDVTVALVDISNAQAVNSPQIFPVALRRDAAAPPHQSINYGMAGGWWNSLTGGQGFLFDFLTANSVMFSAEFTHDALPAGGGPAGKHASGTEAMPIDADEQRWFTAQGNYQGDRADLTIYQTRNGVFDDPAAVTTEAVGSMDVVFNTCKDATLTYDMPGFGLTGVIPLTKLLNDDEVCTGISDGSISISQTKDRSFPEDDMQDINYGLIGGWFNPLTPGQGFLFDFIPATSFMFAAAFTFDIDSPQTGGVIPGAEQRWFTAQGNYSGNRADLTVHQTTGGVFDDPTPVTTEPVGTMIVEFLTCTSANITYDLPQFDLQGVIPVTKLLADELCTQSSQGELITIR